MNRLMQAIDIVDGCLKSGNYQGALNLCGNMMEEMGSNTVILSLLALVLVQSSEQDRASRTIMQILAEELNRMACDLIGKGRREEGLLLLRKAGGISVNNEAVRENLEKYQRTPEKDRWIDAPFGRLRLECFETALGVYFIPSDMQNDQIAGYMKSGRIFDRDIVHEVVSHIRPGTTVIDVGPNMGQMSLIFAKATGPTGKVIAIEAQEKIFEVLKTNVAANHAANIECIYAAAMDSSENPVWFPAIEQSDPNHGSYGVSRAPCKGALVRSVTIDGLAFEQPVSVMKIDVQGADLLVMQGARDTIQKYGMPILFEFEAELSKEYGHSFSDYEAFVSSVGYKFIKSFGGIGYLIAPEAYA